MLYFRNKYLFVCLFVLFSHGVLAADELGSNVVAKVLPYESVYRLVGSFVLVLLLMFAVAYVVKRFNPINANLHEKFKVVSVLSFGGKQKAVLVQIGDEQILLGISQDRINTLHRLTTPIETDQPEMRYKLTKSLS